MNASRALDQLLKFRQLRMVEALVRAPSLTRAAAELGVTQPALTKAVRELEDVLGEPLFERHARGVRPTAAGLALARFARTALAELHRFEDALDLQDEDQALNVAVGVLPVAAVGLLPEVVRRARAEQPAVRIRPVEGSTDALLGRLEAGEIDLIVGRLYSPATPDGFEREALYAEPVSVMARAGHPLHRLRRPAVKDIAAFDLILPEFSQRLGHDIDHVMSAVGLAAGPGALRSGSRGFIREMVLGSDMVTIMPRLLMGGDILRGLVRVVPLPAPALPRPAGIITNPRHGLSPGAKALAGLIRQSITHLASAGDIDITK